jgi:hypothetical protein
VDNVSVIMACENLPIGPSVFLAGPTPQPASGVESWRPAAVRELARQWPAEDPLTILIPEPRDLRQTTTFEVGVGWTIAARAAATVLLYWIPRDMKTLLGMTTNVEFGMDVDTGRAVLGCPPDCPDPHQNLYLCLVARQHGVPVCTTLTDTVTTALHLLLTDKVRL